MEHPSTLRVVPRAVLGAVLAGLLAVPLAACGGGAAPGGTAPAASPPATTAPAGGPTVTIKGFRFTGTLTVAPGATVRVVNEDSAAHTVTAADGSFTSGTVAGSGGTGSFAAPSRPGTYRIGCDFHPSMSGELVVSTSPATSGPGTSAPAPPAGY
ncbi:MAG: cupredoxin domain-containing protein [Actinomycetota bacterium]